MGEVKGEGGEEGEGVGEEEVGEEVGEVEEVEEVGGAEEAGSGRLVTFGINDAMAMGYVCIKSSSMMINLRRSNIANAANV